MGQWPGAEKGEVWWGHLPMCNIKCLPFWKGLFDKNSAPVLKLGGDCILLCRSNGAWCYCLPQREQVWSCCSIHKLSKFSCSALGSWKDRQFLSALSHRATFHRHPPAPRSPPIPKSYRLRLKNALCGLGDLWTAPQMEGNANFYLMESLEVLPHHVLRKHSAFCSCSNGMTLENCQLQKEHMGLWFPGFSLGLHADISSLTTTCTEMACCSSGWGRDYRHIYPSQ